MLAFLPHPAPFERRRKIPAEWISVVKGRHTGKEPVNYGRILAKFSIRYV